MRPLDLFECGLGLHPACVFTQRLHVPMAIQMEKRIHVSLLSWTMRYTLTNILKMGRKGNRGTWSKKKKNMLIQTCAWLHSAQHSLMKWPRLKQKQHDEWRLFRVISLCFSSQIRIAHYTALQRTQSAWQTQIFYTGYYTKTQSCSVQNTHKDKQRSNSSTWGTFIKGTVPLK